MSRNDDVNIPTAQELKEIFLNSIEIRTKRAALEIVEDLSHKIFETGDRNSVAFVSSAVLPGGVSLRSVLDLLGKLGYAVEPSSCVDSYGAFVERYSVALPD